MRLSKSSPTPSAPPPAIARFNAACETEARIIALETSLRDEELSRIAKGERLEADEVARIDASEAAAELLLRGGDVAKQTKKRTIKTIAEESAVARRALAKAQTEVELARQGMAAEKFAQSQAELAEVGHDIVEALFQLDRALRARDLLVHRIGLRTPLPLQGWPLAGRLGNTQSEMYRFAQMAVENGYLTQAEFDKEFAAARKADFWR